MAFRERSYPGKRWTLRGRTRLRIVYTLVRGLLRVLLRLDGNLVKVGLRSNVMLWMVISLPALFNKKTGRVL